MAVPTGHRHILGVDLSSLYRESSSLLSFLQPSKLNSQLNKWKSSVGVAIVL